MHVYYSATNSKHLFGKIIFGKNYVTTVLIVLLSLWIIYITPSGLSYSTTKSIAIASYAVFIFLIVIYILQITTLSIDNNNILIDCIFIKKTIPISNIEVVTCKSFLRSSYIFRVTTSEGGHFYILCDLFNTDISIGMNQFFDHLKEVSNGSIVIQSILPR